jgi:flagellar export protein FliJ
VSGAHFKFRAQAALDLRHRENDAARRVLAKAEADLRAARRLLAEAEERAAAARTRCAALMQKVGGLAEQQWYRSWIIRLDRERAAAMKAVATREVEVTRARVAQARTNQQVESLERFKEKALHAWERQALAEEQKFIDALATMRFVNQSRS